MGWDPRKDIERAVSSVSNATNSFLASAESGIRRDAAGLAENIETNMQRRFQSLAALSQPGGMNNLGQTLLMLGSPGGVLMNPNDQKKITGDTNIDRMQKEGVAKATAQAAADYQAGIDEQNRQISGVLEQVIGARRRAPGRAQTLLGGGSRTSNTLLTSRGA